MSALVVEQILSIEARNSCWWWEHFRANENHQLTIPWDDACPLDGAQRRILLPSLQDFQLGESSEGRHGRARAEAYGERVGDPHYAEAIRLLFAEENRHAAYLARYLRLHGADPIGRSWTDFVFRRVRRLMGLELLLVVLLTAELIGEVYYRAVRAATDCPALRAVCTQLLRDEAMHVRFHIERFRLLRQDRWRMRTVLHDGLWKCFFIATCLAVWLKHRRAFRLGGYPFGRYWGHAHRRRRQAVLAANRPPEPALPPDTTVEVARSYNVSPRPFPDRPSKD
jgi:hypothetical protein